MFRSSVSAPSGVRTFNFIAFCVDFSSGQSEGGIELGRQAQRPWARRRGRQEKRFSDQVTFLLSCVPHESFRKQKIIPTIPFFCVLCVLSWLFNPQFYGRKGTQKRTPGPEPCASPSFDLRASQGRCWRWSRKGASHVSAASAFQILLVAASPRWVTCGFLDIGIQSGGVEGGGGAAFSSTGSLGR